MIRDASKETAQKCPTNVFTWWKGGRVIKPPPPPTDATRMGVLYNGVGSRQYRSNPLDACGLM